MYAKFFPSLAAALFVTSIYSTASLAAPITANVIGAEIGEKDDFGIEYRSGYEWDDSNASQDGTFTDRIDLFYNATEHTQLRTFINRVDRDDADSDITSVFIEPSFQFYNKAEDGFDFAVLTGVAIDTQGDSSDFARIVVTGEVPYQSWNLRHNSIIAHDFGENRTSGVAYQARWRATYGLENGLNVGVEMFNNFGNLRTVDGFDSGVHRAGPVMTGKLFNNIGFQTGILAGLSDNAPDYAAKFWLDYRF